VLFQHLTDLIIHKCLSDHFQVMYLDQKANLEGLELQDSEKVFCIILLVTYADICEKNLKEKAMNLKKKWYYV